ncbi:MAG: hypothetical protein Q7Q71_14730 [Verrucomicrobiota bacterium JB023]|nr:hypothetical protein [Verrucomicrobiota bacterium JB023]
MSILPAASFALSIGLALLAKGEPVFFPNGDFTVGGGASWSELSGEGDFLFTYPETGGNPGGFVEIDQVPGSGGFGILISDGNEVTPLTTLGLVAGGFYTFSLDMLIVDGSEIGGVKVDFYSGDSLIASTGDMRLETIGDGTSWESYDYLVEIPPQADGLKAVLLWGEGAIVGYDNIRVDDEAILPVSDIPDADFSASDSTAFWDFDSGFGTLSASFPATGGNLDGHAVIDHSTNDGGFGVLVSNSDQPLSLAALGLVPGESYRFSQDMKILGGSSGAIGGLKVDFFNTWNYSLPDGVPVSSTTDLRPDLIGDGSTWETYDFTVTVPENASGFKIVPLWGPGSIVGYDNIAVDPEPLGSAPITEIPNGDFGSNGLAWSPVGVEHTTFSYPTEGGHPGGFGIMDNDGAGYGVWVANGGAEIPLSGLNLQPGEAYVFSQDMKLIRGENIGGLKVEFFAQGVEIAETADLYLPLSGDGSEWASYEFTVSIPEEADAFKLVPLWGPGSAVGFDNFMVSDQPVSLPPIRNASFEDGGLHWYQEGEGTAFSFAPSGGNPGAYAVMANEGYGYGVLVANGGAEIGLQELGMTAGMTYRFSQDMVILEGSAIGGFKVDFFAGGELVGSTGDLFPTPAAPAGAWASYDFEVSIPAAVESLKVVLLWAEGATVGFDNITYSSEPLAVPDTFADWIAAYPGVGEETGFLDDPDGDGLSNGVENLFGSDPSAFSPGLLVSRREGNRFIITHPSGEAASDVGGPIYHWSTNLENFHPDGASVGGVEVIFSIAEDTPAEGMVEVSANVDGGLPPALFLRVSAVQALP